jgi:dTDP-4-amino-4,6-dideoxygalactose transaminase|uniref:Putative glutamine--scyllo-inositol transaminase n=1 Tax=uncultured marine virus TaxID=186617 RepID=A0A0F7LAY0_9VIRU|nr:putative glutamine--scyllo-inositol transaminase [uncultured marine virus]
MKRIEFGELKIGPVAKQNLMDVCETNWASAGPKVKELQERWSNLFEYDRSIAMSSGTDGCINSCLVLYDLKNAKRNVSEVIVPALSFIATSNAVRAAGLVPKFVDVKKETLNIDETKIEEAINENTVAIQVVHTMGRMAEMDVICKIAEKHNLVIIEDACEAHGAKYKDKFVGHWGDMSIYSFYVAHLVCCGEGGMVSTNDKEIGDLLFSTRSHGRPFNSVYFDHQRTGLNSKMNDLEASIGLEAIGVFWDTFWTRHASIKTMRNSCLGYEDVAWFSEEDEGNINCPHGFSITCKKEGAIEIVKETLDKYNIHHKRNFGCVPTQHRAFADMGHSLGDFPEAEWVGMNGVHIGCHQYLSGEDIERICKALTEALQKCRELKKETK